MIATINISGVDCGTGLANVAGIESIYVEALKACISDVETKSPFLLEYAKDGRYDEFCIISHAFKGALRGIGATELGDQAYRMELAGKMEDSAAIDAELPQFVFKLREMRDSISLALLMSESRS